MATGRDASHITVLKMTELASQATLLHEVVDVINKAFEGNVGFKSDKPRYIYDLEMVEQIGEGGFCAVMIRNGRVAATASIKKWRPQTGGAVDKVLKVGWAPEVRIGDSSSD